MKASTARGLALMLLLTMQASAAVRAAPSADGAHFASTAVGISLDRPAGWKTLALREVAAPGGSKRLPDDRLLPALAPLEGRPLVEFAKHAEPYPELNPTIQVNVRPLGGFVGRPIAEILSAVVIPLRSKHPDLELIGAAKQVKISGLAALQATTAYSLSVDGRELEVRSHLWVVPRGALFFVIGMTEPPRGPDVAEREFKAALASIHIDP